MSPVSSHSAVLKTLCNTTGSIDHGSCEEAFFLSQLVAAKLVAAVASPLAKGPCRGTLAMASDRGLDEEHERFHVGYDRGLCSFT